MAFNWLRLPLYVALLFGFAFSQAEEAVEDQLLANTVDTYVRLTKRLRAEGPNASFPEFKPVVDALIADLKADWFKEVVEKHESLKLELDEVRILFRHINVDFSFEDQEHYPYQQPFEGAYPYRPTIDAIERAVALFDKVDRLSRPDQVRPLYHFDRYTYHRHRMLADPRAVIIPSMKPLGFLELIILRSVPVGLIGVTTRGYRVDRHYQTPLDFWYHDLNHVRRMIEYLFQYLRERDAKTFEDEIAIYRRMESFIRNTLLPHISKIPLKEDRVKYAERAMLRVIVFEILHESALPADRDMIIDDMLRRPGITQPFEVMLPEAPKVPLNHETLRTATGNLNSGSKAFRDNETKTVNVHFIQDRALTLLGNVYNKIGFGFFDDPHDPQNYVVPVEFRTPENILKASKQLFKILDFSDHPDDETLLGWINSREGQPEKFTYDSIAQAARQSDKDLGGYDLKWPEVRPKTVTEPLSAEEAIRKGRQLKGNKRIVTFMGYSVLGYEHPELLDDVIIRKLKTLDPKTAMICSGSTKGGISRVYELAKEMGFETCGVVSTLALTTAGQFSHFVDHHIIVNDNKWGGRNADGKLTPVSQVFVDLSDEMVAIGGNGNTAIGLEAFAVTGKPMEFNAAEMNHENARREALYQKKPKPKSFEGAAFQTWKKIAAERVKAHRAALCEGGLVGK